MEILKFKDFKNLEYPDMMPMREVLSDLLFKGILNPWEIIIPYTEALEKERHISFCKFEEACITLTQILGKNFKGKHKEGVIKRAIHIFNLTKTLVPHIHDEEHNYTEEDEKEWDEFFKLHYNIDLKK